MDSTPISQEEGLIILKIDMAILSIEKAKLAYTKLFDKCSDLDKALHKATGFQQKKAAQLARIMQFYLPIIINGKKELDLQWGPDQKILDSINKMFIHADSSSSKKG